MTVQVKPPFAMLASCLSELVQVQAPSLLIQLLATVPAQQQKMLQSLRTLTPMEESRMEAYVPSSRLVRNG